MNKQVSNERAAFLLKHSPAHQPFNKDGTIKINRTGKKKGVKVRSQTVED